MTPPQPLRKRIEQIRFHSAEIRRLRSRIDSGEVKRLKPTTEALRRHSEARRELTRELAHAGHQDVVHLLVEEANLRTQMTGVNLHRRVALGHRLDSIVQDIRLRMTPKSS